MNNTPTTDRSKATDDLPIAPLRWRCTRRSGILALAILFLLCLAAALWKPWLSPAQREAQVWLEEFHRLRSQDGDKRLPDWPISSAGQQVLVNRLVRPESKIARSWDNLCRRFPPALRDRLPRLPLARDQVIAIAPALIESPGSISLRQQLLEAAARPDAANRMYAVQVATSPWPVPIELLPALERLSRSEDPMVRMRVAIMLHGIPVGDPRVDRLIAELEADQVSVVREAARYAFRSGLNGEPVFVKPKHANQP
ncbi:MAG TPA: HEAT repeat domain-containing protein [Verrucomicrobiota bacterium]|nr:hypothetical protein [Verrucomicrobiales bacterium]HRI13923.1 HEAT repeat domain-containing protein [Verrucomicrobiota bacterium]